MADKGKREKVLLSVALRTGIGKGPVGEARRQGFVPAVVYRQGEGAVPLQVSYRDLNKVLHTKAGGNVLITLQFDPESMGQLKDREELSGGEGLVLIKEIQHHPVTHQIIHVDFHQISLTKRITVTVPLGFKGEAIGVKQGGGVLEHIRWDLEVECLPTEIPHEIPVEISQLEVGKTLDVREIALPPGVRALTDPDQPVIACVEPKMEETPAPAAEAGATEEPEVIKQKKPEELAAADQPEGKEKEKAKEKPEKAKA